jgi:N-acetylglucosaminyldiphosphoundecaprenol N-acetyl-beta-D-mannosaminyltransferase
MDWSMMFGLIASLLGGKPETLNSRATEVVIDTLRIDLPRLPDAVARIMERIEAGKGSPFMVCCVTPQRINLARSDAAYRRVVNHADLVCAGGWGVRLAGSLLGHVLQDEVDELRLFGALLPSLEARRGRVYLLGGAGGAAAPVAAWMAQHHPGIVVAGAEDLAQPAADKVAVVQRIQATQPDLVVAALGKPLEDRWLAENAAAMGAPVVMGAGHVFDVFCLPAAGGGWSVRWAMRGAGWFGMAVAVLLQRVLGGVKPLRTPVASAAKVTEIKVRSGIVLATGYDKDPLWAEAGLSPGLMPLGERSFVQRTLESLADRGCRDVDLFASEHLEALKLLIDDGAQWGMQVRWHAVVDAADALQRMRLLDLPPGELVWLASADTLVRPDALSLAHGAEECWWGHEPLSDAAAGDDALGREMTWTGWACVSAARLDALSRCVGGAGVFEALKVMGIAGRPASRLAALSARTPAALLASERMWLSEVNETHHTLNTLAPGVLVAATARVAPDVQWRPPVVIGERCDIQGGAIVGPHVVLQPNVHLESGTQVSHAVVLAGTYLANGLEVEEAIAGPRGLLSARWGVWLPATATPGLLCSLHGQGHAQRVGVAERALAAVLVLAMVFAWLLHVLTLGWLMRGPLWKDFLGRVGPRLPQVVLSGVPLVGVSAREIIPASVQEAGWADLLDGATPGLISPANAWPEVADDPDAAAWADVHWLLHVNWGERSRIVRAYLNRLSF